MSSLVATTYQAGDHSGRERDTLWASFQASVAAPASINEQPVEKLVKIERRYLFAGKHVTFVLSYIIPNTVRCSWSSREVVEVAADSEDAKKWPLWQPQAPGPDGDPTLPTEKETAATTSISATSDTTPAKPATERRTGPRKPRTVLPSIPTPGSSKAKKITTLDKSAMDWRAHVTSQPSDTQGELAANRRGGGYLEKVDFLQRVEDRRQDVLEASKSSKRRKL